METSVVEIQAPPGHYLGPATVQEQIGGAWVVALPDRTARASSALAYPYTPVPGDRVLVIGEREVYIIGVLQGKGRTRLHVAGDLDLEAGGTLHLRGRSGVEIEGAQVRLRAERFETAVEVVAERIGTCYRWVKGLFQTMAGRTRTVVEKSATLKADRIVEQAKGDVVVDGKHIRLG